MDFEASFNPRDRTLNPLAVDAPDILAWIERKAPAPIGGWQELGGEEYARAFTAARTAGYDVVDDLYFGFYDTIAKGGTEADFAKLVTPILKQKGWLKEDGEKGLARRVQLIYDTNLRLARADGRWTRYHRTKAAFPYLRAVTVRDDRVRHPPKSEEDHRAWDGIILPIEHPFWTRWFPPLGFRCRCSVIQMTRSQLARYAGGITSEADLASREARLGRPVFLSPAAPMGAKIADMVEETNASRMPGLPPIVPEQQRRLGVSLFETILADKALESVREVIAKIFGNAA